MFMKKQLNQKLFHTWRESVGGEKPAALLIKEKLKCSLSKAEKIAGGRYDSLPPCLEMMALSELMSKPMDALIRTVGKTVTKAS